MPSINMIAARRAEKMRLEKQIRIALFSVVGVGAVVVCLTSYMAACIYSAGRDIQTLDIKIRRIEPVVEKIRVNEKDIDALKPKLELLDQSRKETLLWSAVLSDLSKSMPQKTWLSNVSTTVAASTTPGTAPEPGGKRLALKGISVSQELVGEAMLRLSSFNEFQKVDLSYTQKGGAEMQTLDFEIAATLRSLEAKKGGTTANASGEAN
jgi:Tfp pilus assembly protein PilN